MKCHTYLTLFCLQEIVFFYYIMAYYDVSHQITSSHIISCNILSNILFFTVEGRECPLKDHPVSVKLGYLER